MNEFIKSKDSCKYTPRSAGSVRRPQRSEDVLGLVQFLNDNDISLSDDDLMGLGNGSASDFWVRKEPQKAKKSKSQEDLPRPKGWQRGGFRWKRNRGKHFATVSDPDDYRPPPISKDPMVPQLLLSAARTKSMPGDVDCECFYPGVGTLPAAADLSDGMRKRLGSVTTMWMPPTLEMPLTPTSCEYSPVTDTLEQKLADSSCENSSHGSQTPSSVESKLEVKCAQSDEVDVTSKSLHSPFTFETAERTRCQSTQAECQPILSSAEAARQNSYPPRSSSRGAANQIIDLHKRDGVCVTGPPQTHIALSSALNALSVPQKQSPYIDAQYLPRRTSSRRSQSHAREQTDPCCLSQPLSEESILAAFQQSLNINTATSYFSDPESSSALVRMPTRKYPLRRPAPLVLSQECHLDSAVKTLPPTPASPPSTMGKSRTGSTGSADNPVQKASTVTAPHQQGPELRKPQSKHSLWPPKLTLRPSRDKISKPDAMSPWRGNAFAQMNSLPTAPTSPLDPSARSQETELRAIEPQPALSPHTNNMATPAVATIEATKTTPVEHAENRDNASIQDGEISPKTIPTRRNDAASNEVACKSPNLRSHPGEPPKGPLPQHPAHREPTPTSTAKIPIERSEVEGKHKARALDTPTIDEKAYEQIRTPRTPGGSLRTKHPATPNLRDSQSSLYSRPSKTPVIRTSWDTVDMNNLTSRPVTPSLPSSDDEKGVYAYHGSGSRSGKSKRRHRGDIPSIDAYASPSIHRRKDRDNQQEDDHLHQQYLSSRPSTRSSLDHRRNINSPSPGLSTSSSRAESAVIRQLQEKIVFLERQNKMLHAALSAALEMGGTYDVGLSRASFAHSGTMDGASEDMLMSNGYEF